MIRPLFVRLSAAFILAIGLIGGTARAAGIAVTNNNTAADLVNTLLGGGAGGITVTGFTLDSQSSGNAQSTGIYTTAGANHYNLTGTGIVLSTGNAADEKSGPVVSGITTGYDVPATAAQTALLSQVATTSSGFFDVTQLTVTFTAGPNTSKVFFNGVFASAEYPHFVGSFTDAFGLFLNGTNIAFAGGHPVDIDSPLMVNTDSTDPTGNVQPQYQETALQGLLVQANGNPVVTFSGDVTPGSTGNTLTFIIADNNDSSLDTAIYLQGLGQAPPPTVPEPSAVMLMCLGVAGIAGYTRRLRTKG